MKKSFVLFSVIFIGFLVITAADKGKEVSIQDIKALDLSVKSQDIRNSGSVKPDLDFGKFPLYFIFNKGQVNEKAKFYAKASRYTLWLTKEGLVFESFRRSQVKVEVEDESPLPNSPHSPYSRHSPKLEVTKPPSHQENSKDKEGIHHSSFITHHLSPNSPTTHQSPRTTHQRDVSRLSFIGANKNPEIVPVEETQLRVNYFKGNDKSKWHCDIPTSLAVLYKNIYKNIDLKVYGIEKQIEYDWIVKPGGNPEDIRVEYKNVKGTRIDAEGNLLIETDFGELMHKKPVSYQQICMEQGARSTEERIDIEVKFKKIKENTYVFEVDEYDKSKELIIDPVVLAYSTYLGGISEDYGYGIAVDSGGNAYVAGHTLSTNFPCLNQYQTKQGGYDVFVTKIDTTQSGVSSLIYSTYLGGGSRDSCGGIAVDSSGNAYVTGFTDSTDFPCKKEYQTDPGDSRADTFVTKIDTTKSGASSLIYSTYLGGWSWDFGHGIAVDSSGNAYVTGETDSTDFPCLNQFQTESDGIVTDAFVSKIDTTKSGASSLIYSTYLGGRNLDSGGGIAADSSGNAYVTGWTFSTDFPCQNQYQTSRGSPDAFVTKIDTTQSGVSSLIYSTYLGGWHYDSGGGIAVDSSGNAYVTGETWSTDFPCKNQYQPTLKGDIDAFVSKIDTTQSGVSSLIYSTYLGGGSSDSGGGIAVDSSGNAYAIGGTLSTDFPCQNQYQTYQGGSDAFVTKIDTTRSGASSLIYSTYLGGGSSDSGGGIAVDSSGNAYAIGGTLSTDFPCQNQYQTNQGSNDAFVTKIVYVVLPTVKTKAVSGITPPTASSGGNVTSNGGAAVTARGVCWSTSPDPTTADNHTTDGTGTGTFTSSITGLKENTTYYLRAYATNSVGTGYGKEIRFSTSAATVSVFITEPQDEAVVEGIITIKASTTSSSVKFYIDDILLWEDTTTPYECEWDTRSVSNGMHTIKAIAYDLGNQSSQDEITVEVENIPNIPPHIYLSRTRLNYGADQEGRYTGSQDIFIDNTGGGTLNWSINNDTEWLLCSPGSGTGTSVATVSINPEGLIPGTYMSTITFESADADNSPQGVEVYLNIYGSATASPFGYFETPVDGSTVMSSIPVTGWVLDDIDVKNVKIYRGPDTGEGSGLVYIGAAVIVEGARPDVEQSYPDYPRNYQAGWGYMLLTNMLPNQGNGTFTLYAKAVDKEGNEILLGTKRITCDNEHAVKPFGAIDTPGQGGDASGMDFVNFGWALTPLPNTIPTDGSTINVWVDGVPLTGSPVYNRYREDIATLFPGYNNSDGAVGYYFLDTTLYANGIHTIAWSVQDDAGNSDGVGSRYFRILNVANKTNAQTSHKYNSVDVLNMNPSSAPVFLERGYDHDSEPQTLYPDKQGIIDIVIKEDERIEIGLRDQGSGSTRYFGYLVIGQELRRLPIGSFLDSLKGIFYWQPGPGYLGKYRLVFIEKDPNDKTSKKQIRITITSKY